MIENFPLLKQSNSGNDCLPTCVRAVLLWHGERATREEVSVWCQETAKGCFLDAALEGLRNAGFDVIEIVEPSEDAEEALRQHFVEDEAEPVLVTLLNSIFSGFQDHAVVVTDIRRISTLEGVKEIVEYMDPLVGDLVEENKGAFWYYWASAGQRAFILRP